MPVGNFKYFLAPVTSLGDFKVCKFFMGLVCNEMAISGFWNAVSNKF